MPEPAPISDLQPAPVPIAVPAFRGIIPILFAFFDSSGGLDRQAMRRQVQTLRKLGAPAIAVLGLATEVNKLDGHERRLLIDWAAEDLEGAAPLIVTVNGDRVEDQIELAAYAQQGRRELAGASAAPEGAGRGGSAGGARRDYRSLLRRVLPKGAATGVLADGHTECAGVSGRRAVGRVNCTFSTDCGALRMIKGEGPSVVIRRLIEAVGPSMPVFNGRGGQELLDNLRAGCAGMIVAPDTWDWQQRVHAAFERGDEAAAESLYREVLPAIVFAMQSLDSLICYGKRIAAWRMGLEVFHDRKPALMPSSFGIDAARRFVRQLGLLPKL